MPEFEIVGLFQGVQAFSWPYTSQPGGLGFARQVQRTPQPIRPDMRPVIQQSVIIPLTLPSLPKIQQHPKVV
jgi:hypothetical protein